MNLTETILNLTNFFTSYGERYMSTITETVATRTPNYTDDMVRYMVAEYTATPHLLTVDRLAKELKKNKRSIIAKLVREGVYVAQPRQTKSGAPVIRKAQLVDTIQSHFGINTPSLEKASKADLQTIVDAINA